MESIRKFIDFCGPAVYVVMFLLAGYLVPRPAGRNIDFNLAEGGLTLTGWAVGSGACCPPSRWSCPTSPDRC